MLKSCRPARPLTDGLPGPVGGGHHQAGGRDVLVAEVSFLYQLPYPPHPHMLDIKCGGLQYHLQLQYPSHLDL